MLPPDSIIGESPMVVEVVNRAIVLGVPLPPTCARPVETKNEPSTSDPRMLRFMMRLRFRSDLRYVGVHVAHLGRLVRGASKGALRFATFTLTRQAGAKRKVPLQCALSSDDPCSDQRRTLLAD